MIAVKSRGSPLRLEYQLIRSSVRTFNESMQPSSRLKRLISGVKDLRDQDQDQEEICWWGFVTWCSFVGRCYTPCWNLPVLSRPQKFLGSVGKLCQIHPRNSVNHVQSRITCPCHSCIWASALSIKTSLPLMICLLLLECVTTSLIMNDFQFNHAFLFIIYFIYRCP